MSHVLGLKVEAVELECDKVPKNTKYQVLIFGK